MADTEAAPVFRRVLNLLTRAMRTPVSGSERKSLLVAAQVEMGMCLAHLGREGEAEAAYDKAILLSSEDEGALVARGVFDYKRRTELAVKDFRKAAEQGTRLVWPFLFLAHWSLASRRFNECVSWVDQGLERSRSSQVSADLYEWKAIALYELGAPSNTVSEAFSLATQLSPSSERIRRNVLKFQQVTQARTRKRVHMEVASAALNARTLRQLEILAPAAA